LLQSQLKIAATQTAKVCDGHVLLAALAAAGFRENQTKWLAPVIWTQLGALAVHYASISIPGPVIEAIVSTTVLATYSRHHDKMTSGVSLSLHTVRKRLRFSPPWRECYTRYSMN